MMKRLASIFVVLFSITLCLTSCQKSLLQAKNSIVYDKSCIEELINNWTFYRDQEQWSKLSGTFYEEGTISLSWFDGPFNIFVKASKDLAKNKNVTLKHYVGKPMMTLNGNKAISEVNVTIKVRTKTKAGEMDLISYARFYDFIEKKSGEWKILKRFGIYEMDRLDPVQQAIPAEFYRTLGKYPEQLRFMAATLEKVGKELSASVVIDKSQELEALYEEGRSWLSDKHYEKNK